jgi:Carboxypeptidase regulatory-like domain
MQPGRLGVAQWLRNGAPFVICTGCTSEDKAKLLMALQSRLALIIVMIACLALGWTLSCLGQTSQQPPPPGPERGLTASAAQVSGQRTSGNISGTIVDQSGAVVPGARVALTNAGPPRSPETISGERGQFSFANVPAGAFQLTISAAGFAGQTYSGMLHPGETALVPQIALQVAATVTEVEVGLKPADIAEEQIAVEEKQRVLGAIPNFYVSYLPNAVPLTSRQKFKLAARTVVDPFTLVVVGGTAGVQQAQNHFQGYGQGAQGYAKRFGAGYADTVAGTFIGGAVLPSLLKQDPRYFYKGTGSTHSRALYAIANSVICKGDNGRWQVNYSNILGNLAAGGISNLYYPADDRNGAGLTFENGGIGIGSTAVMNLLQEFVIRKLSRKVPGHDSAKP